MVSALVQETTEQVSSFDCGVELAVEVVPDGEAALVALRGLPGSCFHEVACCADDEREDVAGRAGRRRCDDLVVLLTPLEGESGVLVAELCVHRVGEVVRVVGADCGGHDVPFGFNDQLCVSRSLVTVGGRHYIAKGHYRPRVYGEWAGQGSTVQTSSLSNNPKRER